jgi:hypothetical protein
MNKKVDPATRAVKAIINDRGRRAEEVLSRESREDATDDETYLAAIISRETQCVDHDCQEAHRLLSRAARQLRNGYDVNRATPIAEDILAYMAKLKGTQ